MKSNHKFEISAQIRSDIGKGASRRLRHADKVPGIVYGGGKETTALTIEHKAISKSLENELFYSKILTLKLDKGEERVILKDLQRHPYRPIIMHIDFQRIRADEKLHMNIPIHFLNADQAPGVKIDGGSISHLITEVEVSCLPDHLPESIEINLAEMKLNDIIHLSDLSLPKDVELVALTHGDDKAIVSLHMPRAEKEEVEETVAPTEVPTVAQTTEPKGEEEK